MKRVARISTLLVAFAMLSCTPTNQTARKSVFAFNYQNQTFEIVSVNTASGEGTNILSLVGSEQRISAQDVNQDGILDVVVQGSVDISELNAIYATGIHKAQLSGNYQEREAHRQFKWVNENYTLIINTYVFNELEVNNLFTIKFTETGDEALFTDLMADGTLDTNEKGTVNLQRAQQLYEMTLLKGVDEGRIQKTNLFYQVLPDRPTSNLPVQRAITYLQ